MKKRKLIPLTMMICSMCFATACGSSSSITTNEIAKIGDKKIYAEDIYNYALYDQKTAEYVYGVLEKALIQSAVPATNTVKTNVENEVKRWKAKIEADSKLNGTDFEEDLDAALLEEGVSSVEELTEKKIYDYQYTYAKNKFLQAKGADYSKSYIDSNYLYHIGDINISISSSSNNTDLYNLTISSTEAKNIYDAFNELVEGENYYTVAERYSSTTAQDGGEVGIVTLNDADITNELRYALVGYSSIIEDKYDEFDLPNNAYTNVLTDLYNGGLQSIPFSYIKKLNEVYKTENGKETKNYETNNSFYYSGGGNSVSSSNKVYYRNILFNNLLNTKTPKFITVTSEDVENGANAIELNNVLVPNVNAPGYSSEKTTQYVLANDAGNPYVVFKDSKGLHILSINKTPFAEDLYEYYSSDPSEDYEGIGYVEYGKNSEEKLAEVEGFAEKYITRNYGGNTGEDKLMSFAMFRYYLDEVENGNFKIVNEDVKKMINLYMESISELADTKIGSDYKGYYDTYSNLIWFRNQDYIVKQVALLSCLEKASDGNYGCTYKYGEGFINHAPASSGGENNE